MQNRAPAGFSVLQPAQVSAISGDHTARQGASRATSGVSGRVPARYWAGDVAGERGRVGTVAVVYLEADDVGSAMEQVALSEEPFDQWFRERIQEVHGVDLAEPQPPPEQVLDTRF